jgi:SAM-dependent methyltransferase
MPDCGHTIKHPVFARVYARLSRREAGGIRDHRRALLAGLSGRVLELGAGNGLNFPYYPPAVTEVVALEPEPYLRGLAEKAAGAVPTTIRVIDAVGEAIPAPDGAFDHVVTALVLCSVSDPRVVLAELRRVLAAQGSLRYYEHVAALSRKGALTQRLLDATVWPRIAGGCHLSRETGAVIRESGFSVAQEQRLAVKTSPVEPAIAHILGSATRT